MPLATIILFLTLAAAGFGYVYFVHWADRQRLVRHFSKQGATIISMERIVPARSLTSERNTTFWRVRYRAADGSTHVAECFASVFRCRIYRDDAEDSHRT